MFQDRAAPANERTVIFGAGKGKSMMTMAILAAIVAVPAAMIAAHFAGIDLLAWFGLGSGLAVGAVVQSTYSERMAAGLPGMIANMQTYDIDTRQVENSNGVPFGRAVGRGTADGGAKLGADAVTDFLGISVRDVTLSPLAADSDYVDEYQRYASMAVLIRGDIWVTTGGAVVDGDAVTFNATTGVLSSAATSGSQFLITGARWMRTAASGALSIVRLSGELPSV